MKKSRTLGLISIICSVLLVLVGINTKSCVLAAETSGDVFKGSIILGRPTSNTMTASITAEVPTTVYLEWGAKSGEYTSKSIESTSAATQPAVIVMNELEANKEYYYKLSFKPQGEMAYSQTQEYKFTTPRTTGTSYNFVIQSDSHLLNKADSELYSQVTTSMASQNPDFMFDLGDTFLNDKDIANQTYENVRNTYTQQLPYFDTVTRNAPLFLTIGNHEGEFGSYLDGTMNNVAAMSTKARTTFFPNPVPNTFYSGNTKVEPLLGAPQNYYAFTWGDALYVSIDPYRYSEVDPYGNEKDGWSWTLGKEQYDWFRKTLETSNAKYKFVFSHHAIGNTRGGEQVAKLYEWGGYDQKGKYLFDEKRPGWGKPIQQVMADNGVTIFFQGHDHLFAREVVDGVIYQTLPKPAEKIADQQSNFDAYPNADKLMNSGYLNVTVTPENVRVDYIRDYYVSSDSQEDNTGIVYSYTVDDQGSIKVLKNNKDDLTTYGGNAESISKPDTGKGNNTIKPNTEGKNKGNKQTEAILPTYPLASIPQGGYSFAIQADSHLDENTNPLVYQKTLDNIKAQQPDLLIDLGDTFMSEKFARTQLEVEARYQEAQSYFDTLENIPLYLVTGNHEGENGWNLGKNGNQVIEWARAARHKYFPAIMTEQNYSGNTETANYYAFTKGDVQYIVLDPYTYTTQKTKDNTNGWVNTLGKVQYDWLKNILEKSTSKYKFVFIHNLVGGSGKDSRGGVEAAQFYEWGGYNVDGTYAFDTMRPGWEKPIHQLLVDNNVSAVFHGHDHFYGKQELDGIIYQLVPQPGTPGNSIDDKENYSYEEGTFLPSTGHLRVVVGEDKIVVEYIRSSLQDNLNGTVIDTYNIYPK